MEKHGNQNKIGFRYLSLGRYGFVLGILFTILFGKFFLFYLPGFRIRLLLTSGLSIFYFLILTPVHIFLFLGVGYCIIFVIFFSIMSIRQGRFQLIGFCIIIGGALILCVPIIFGILLMGALSYTVYPLISSWFSPTFYFASLVLGAGLIMIGCGTILHGKIPNTEVKISVVCPMTAFITAACLTIINAETCPSIILSSAFLVNSVSFCLSGLLMKKNALQLGWKHKTVKKIVGILLVCALFVGVSVGYVFTSSGPLYTKTITRITHSSEEVMALEAAESLNYSDLFNLPEYETVDVGYYEEMLKSMEAGQVESRVDLKYTAIVNATEFIAAEFSNKTLKIFDKNETLLVSKSFHSKKSTHIARYNESWTIHDYDNISFRNETFELHFNLTKCFFIEMSLSYDGYTGPLCAIWRDMSQIVIVSEEYEPLWVFLDSPPPKVA